MNADALLLCRPQKHRALRQHHLQRRPARHRRQPLPDHGRCIPHLVRGQRRRQLHAPQLRDHRSRPSDDQRTVREREAQHELLCAWEWQARDEPRAVEELRRCPVSEVGELCGPSHIAKPSVAKPERLQSALVYWYALGCPHGTLASLSSSGSVALHVAGGKSAGSVSFATHCVDASSRQTSQTIERAGRES